MYRILEKVNHFLNKFNRDIRVTNSNALGYYLQTFDDIDFLECNSGVFQIDLSKCVSQHYFSYAEDGWHYYDALVKEYISNPSIVYSESILCKYYNHFRPKNLQETLFDDDTLINTTIEKLPNIAVRVLWELCGTFQQIKAYLISEQTQLFGPVDDLYGEEQFRRCIRAYQLIKKHGFVPDKFHDGFISGFFIKSADDYRFCVISGKHRVAALNSLGYEKIPVTCSGLLKVVDLNKIYNIPIVKSGLITDEIAEILIKRYFKENGSNRAKQLGLLSSFKHRELESIEEHL